jgi:membrane protein DedA with SNARE-associated domain
MRWALLPYLRQFTYGAAFALLVAAGLAVPIPQDVTLILSGYLLNRGVMNPAVAFPVCIAGALGGDVLLFWIARGSATRLSRSRILSGVLTPERFSRAEAALARHGAKTIIVARHVAGLRAAVTAVAGATGMPFGRFLFWDFISAFPSVGLMLGLGYVFSDRLSWLIRRVSHVEHWMATCAVGLAVVAIAAWQVWKRRARPLVDRAPR